MENNLLTHTKHETTHFDVLSDKRQTVKVFFLPFAGKINVKLNLSNFYFLFLTICQTLTQRHLNKVRSNTLKIILKQTVLNGV